MYRLHSAGIRHTYVAGESGEHRNDSVVGDYSQVLFITSDARHGRTDASQHVDTLRLEQADDQLETTHEATHQLTRVLYTHHGWSTHSTARVRCVCVCVCVHMN